MGDVPRSDLYNDVYFSAQGGPDETRHVFLDGNDLPHRWQGGGRHTIGETGFGTGLNFLLAWKLFDKTAAPGALLDFVSVEKHPLTPKQIREGLSPWAVELSPYLEKMLAQYPMRVPGFHRMVFDNRVALTLIFDDANQALAQIEGSVDSWFLDGFTPSKNPAMWTQEVFDQMARLSHDQTTFSTFTAAGFVKRGLRDAGFTVEKRPGFGAKRDRLAGNYTQRHKPSSPSPGTVAIIGAGLAGTACAHVLRQYGLNVKLYDSTGIAAGASGNDLGLINPRLSALRTAESDFYTSAYALALRTLQMLPNIDFEQVGALHLIMDAEKQKRLYQTQKNWAWSPEHMVLVSAQEASEIAGITLDNEALYLADSGFVSPRKLSAALAEGTDCEVRQITTLDDIEADVIILANGAGAAILADLPIHTVRGQITQIGTETTSQSLRCNLHYGGYLSAAREGRHMVGSTFQRWIDHTETMEEDNAYNLSMMTKAVPSLQANYRVMGARASLRCASKDRFPLIGVLNDSVYLSVAHGSHGIVSALAGAHILADILRGGIRSQSRDTQGILSPRRFTAG